ncbi:MAG: ABC transporter ATP-binding protein, partial [Gemmatimonadales bacterium]
MSHPATLHEEEALGKAYDRRLMRRLLTYVRPYRALVAGALVCLCFEGALQLVGPILTQRVIDVALPRHDMSIVKNSAVLFVVALLAQFLCAYGETWLTSLLGQRVMRDLRMEVFTHLQRLSIPFFDRNPAGRLVTRVTSDVEALNELFTSGVVSGLGDVFTLVAISVAMFVMDWRFAIVAHLVIPLVALASHLFRTGVREAYRAIRTRLARINAFLQERLTAMRIVQLYGQERAEGVRFEKLNRDHLEAHLRSIRVYALYFPAVEILLSVGLATLIVASGSRVGAGTLTVGTVAAFLQLLRRFFEPLQDLAEKFNIVQAAMASSERIFGLLDTEPGETPRLAVAEPRRRLQVEVRFENVWFAYDRGHRAAGDADPLEPE